jgi:hypothetical protein
MMSVLNGLDWGRRRDGIQVGGGGEEMKGKVI